MLMVSPSSTQRDSASPMIALRSMPRPARVSRSSMHASRVLQPRLLQQHRLAPVVAVVDLAVHQQRQALFEAQRRRAGGAQLLLQGLGEAGVPWRVSRSDLATVRTFIEKIVLSIDAVA